MNPFLYSTVAQPLGVADFAPDGGRSRLRARPAAASMASPAAAAVAVSTPTPGTPLLAAGGNRRRPALPEAARSLLLAASIGWAGMHAAQAAPVNANLATAAQLETIKGIGPKTAQIIIQERERSGPFESIQDLAERVRGIGPRKARALREAGLTVSQGAPPAAITLR